MFMILSDRRHLGGGIQGGARHHPGALHRCFLDQRRRGVVALVFQTRLHLVCFNIQPLASSKFLASVLDTWLQKGSAITFMFKIILRI
jgi:hypothetical protein